MALLNKKKFKANYYQASNAIDRSSVSIRSIRVLEELKSRGYEGYIVGGAIRDLLLGRRPKDFDIATNAKPEEIIKIFKRSRIIGRRFKIVHIYFSGEIIEVTTFRKRNTKNTHVSSNGRILLDNCFGSISEDAERRDFSVNSLYYDYLNNTIIDFHNGYVDLKNKILSIIGDPYTRYSEDPVRILRAIRFSSKLGFEIEERSLKAINKTAKFLGDVPEARLFDELSKMLLCGNSMNCVTQIMEHRVYKYSMPYIAYSVDNKKAREFILNAMSHIDILVNSDKLINKFLVFALLMWPEISSYYSSYIKELEPIEAMKSAIDDIHRSYNYMFIPRGFMNEIETFMLIQAFMDSKPPLEEVISQLKYKSLRYAYIFLNIREKYGDLDTEICNHWDGVINKSALLASLKKEKRYRRLG